MSNGDDVLDSWEEIDEADLTKSLHNNTTESNIKEKEKSTSQSQYVQLSSSEKNPSPTEFRPMKLLQRQPMCDGYSNAVTTGVNLNVRETVAASTDDMSALDTMTAAFKPVLMMLHKPDDEYQSANYTTPITNQTVKILRRPAQSSDSARNNGLVRPKQPIKSLQQREQEYAEARLRILGAAKNPDDDVNETDVSKNQTAGTRSANSELASTTTVKNNHENIVDKSRLVSTVDGGCSESPFKNHHMQQKEDFFYASAAAFQTRPLPTMATMPMQALETQTYPLMHGMPHQNHLKQQLYPQTFHQQKQWPTPTLNQQQQQQQVVVRQGQTNNKQTYAQNENVRLPRGPDGSLGFQIRR